MLIKLHRSYLAPLSQAHSNSPQRHAIGYRNIRAEVYSITRWDNGTIKSIYSRCEDESVIRHIAASSASSGDTETSMIPFLDSHHVDVKETHKFRVKFQGVHAVSRNGKELPTSGAPMYTFYSDKGKVSHN